MSQASIHSRALVGLLAGGLALAAIAVPSRADAHHLPPTQHKPTDIAVVLRLAGKDSPVQNGHQYFEARPGTRLAFEAVMSTAGEPSHPEWSRADRTHLKISLPPSLTDVVVPKKKTDECTLTTIAEEGKLPGTIIECQASYFALNGVNEVLLYAGEPRSVYFEATGPSAEGEHRVTATVEPVKYWDEAPADNTVTGHLKLAQKPRYEDVLVTPAMDVDPSRAVDPNVRVVTKPEINPCAIRVNGC